MDLLTKTLTKIFGSKSERDIKQLAPYVDDINAIYSELHDITNDELREKAQEIRREIEDYIRQPVSVQLRTLPNRQSKQLVAT